MTNTINKHTETLQKTILELNNHLNCKVQRTVETRQALGSKGIDLLNGLFEASCQHNLAPDLNNLLSKVKAFLSFLEKNPTKNTDFKSCMSITGRKNFDRLGKTVSQLDENVA